MAGRRQFRLEPVLRLREQREKQLQGELAHVLRQQLEQEQLLGRMKDNRHIQLELLTGYLTAGKVEMTYVQFGHAYLERLQSLIDRQGNVVKQAVWATNQKRAEVVQAMKQRKVIEKLKERWHEALLEDERQRDIKTVDEIGTTQFNQTRLVGRDA